MGEEVVDRFKRKESFYVRYNEVRLTGVFIFCILAAC